MPDYIEKQEGLFGVLARIVFRAIFYIVVLLIFVGDIIILIIKSILDLLKYIGLSLLFFFEAIGRVTAAVYEAIVGFVTGSTEKATKAVKKAPPLKKATGFSFSLSSIAVRARYFLFGLLFALLAVFTFEGYEFLVSLPNPRLIGNINYPVSTQIYDRNGNLLYDVFRDQDRTPVNVDELPDHVIQATIAIEDRAFYSHNGISPIGGILRAMKDTFLEGDLQGGSTITQQLVKTSLLTPERTFERKFREAILALWAEQIFTKKEILEMYFNQVPYGGSAYGIEEASKTYFNKPAKDLTINESAFLAGLTRAPSRYSPYVNPELAVRRRNEVLRSMLETGYLTEDQYEEQLQASLVVERPKIFIRAPHFVFYVKALLEEQFGIRRVEEGGLRVVTTLDLNIQDQAEQILNEELDKLDGLNVTNGAVLVSAPSTGEVLAMVGSRNYFSEPYGAFNVATARRQPGSSIKPVLYALALEKQFTAASIIQDTPVAFDIPGGPTYKPVNYDGRFHGPVSLRYALANSYNIPAVKILNSLGVENFINHAENMGISTWDTPERYGLSLALGGAEVTMTDMAVAFGVFSNYGQRQDLNPFISVEDYRGQTLYSIEQAQDSAKQVLSPQSAFIISDILSDNFARQFEFGPNSDLVIPGYKVAAKTGTSNDKRDNWTFGYNRKYLTGVWVGNNDNSPMSQVTSGVTGASPIWNRVMSYVLDKNVKLATEIQPPAAFSIPDGIVSRQCYFGKVEFFKTGTESQANCSGKLFGTTPGQEPTPQPDQPQ